MPEAVLFDLDGTLADTAPDLGGAMNRLLREQGREPMSLGMSAACFVRRTWNDRLSMCITPADTTYPTLQQRFLSIYQECRVLIPASSPAWLSTWTNSTGKVFPGAW